MAHDITVDTSPMAHSLDRVSHDIKLTTVAVTAMSREICAAEEQAAREVCENVNKGFLALVHSQISQKKVLAQTAAEAQLVSLRQSVQSLRRIKTQMTRDFQRITSRFSKIFTTLNDTLKARIYALDKPASDLADSEYNAMNRRIFSQGAPLAVIQEEIIDSLSGLVVARCKKNCGKVIQSAKTLIRYGNALRTSMEEIIQEEQAKEMHPVYMPVLFCETTDLYLPSGSNLEIYCGGEPLQARLESDIKSKYYDAPEHFQWGMAANDSSREKIVSYVRERIQAEKLDTRLAEIIMNLLNKSNWAVLKEIQ